MSFNPGSSKYAQEVIFIRKVNKDSHPPLPFNSLPFIFCQATSQKYLGIMFDNHLSFEEHLRLVFIKINRIIGLLCKFQCLIPTSATLTTNKTFVSLHLHYGDIIYEKVYNSSFHQKIEPVRYNTCLTITGALRGTSIEKLYDELSL